MDWLGTRSGFIGAWVMCALGLLAAPRGAQAIDLLGEGDLKVRVEGWVRAGYAFIREPAADEGEHGPYLGLVRAVGEGRYQDWGRAFVQLEANSETMKLLDAIAELRPVAPLLVRFGRFKVPTSVDYLIFGPRTPFVNRAYLVQHGFVPTRRLGAEAIAKHRFGPVIASVQAGWFIPSQAELDRLPDAEGYTLSLRAQVEFDIGLRVHLAYADLLLADNEFAGGVIPDGFAWSRPIPLDRQLDAAVVYKAGGWTGYLEGVWALDAPGGEVPYAAYLMVLKDFALPDTDVTLEPGLRYDNSRRDEVTRQRVTAGLTAHFVGDFLSAAVNYELLLERGESGHAGYIQLQAGF